MSEHEHLEEILRELHQIRRDIFIMSANNDEALANLQAAQAQLSTDVEALIASISTGSASDISAGVDAVTSSLGTLDSQVTAATEGTPPAPAPADVPEAPVDAPAAPPAPSA